MPYNPTDAQQTTPLQVAEWMVAQLEEHDDLPQQAAAYHIQERFGPAFVCRDQHGELGIARRVLYQFRKLTEDSVVWVADPNDWLAGYWRKRAAGDGAGRKQSIW